MNRLRWRLVVLCPDVERALKPRAFRELRTLGRADRRLRRMPDSIALRVARADLARARRLTREVDALERELLGMVRSQRPWLLDELGCSALTAAVLIGRTAGAERFRSEACFGRQTGASPIPCSSGQRTQQRLNRGGDRQLNCALHTIAVTRAHYNPNTKRYLERKQAEGKTTKGALRCLKRSLARRFYRLLARPPLPAALPADQTNASVVAQPDARAIERTTTAPGRMICVT